MRLKEEKKRMKEITREQLIEMGNDWLRMQFVTGDEHFAKLFSEMATYDYIALLLLQRRMGLGDDRIYLKEICEELDMQMAQVSKIVQRMQNRGFVYWTHDASDRPGTFITLSESGRDTLERQEERIAVFFEKAITKYGADDFIKLMDLRKRFNDTMEEVLEESE